MCLRLAAFFLPSTQQTNKTCTKENETQNNLLREEAERKNKETIYMRARLNAVVARYQALCPTRRAQ